MWGGGNTHVTTHIWVSEDNIGSVITFYFVWDNVSLVSPYWKCQVSWPTNFHGFSFLRLPSCHRRTAITDMSYCAWLYMVCGDRNSGPRGYTARTLFPSLPSRVPSQKVQNLVTNNTCCQLFPWTWDAHLVHSKKTHVQKTKVCLSVNLLRNKWCFMQREASLAHIHKQTNKRVLLGSSSWDNCHTHWTRIAFRMLHISPQITEMCNQKVRFNKSYFLYYPTRYF